PLLVAVLAFRLPPLAALSGAAEGALFGLFPIVWIIVNAVWLGRLINRSSHGAAIRRVFLRLSGDFRVQALVISFCFGSLLESMAGFGAPIAVVAPILLTLGFSPLRAATVAMFADAAGTAFGSVGNPIFALAKATGLAANPLGEMVGRQAPIVAFFVPFALVIVLDGRRGFTQLWPVALVLGLGFAVGQYATANFVTFQLADLIGALVATACAALLLRFWSPRDIGSSPAGDTADRDGDGGGSVVRAFAPYAALTVVLVMALAYVLNYSGQAVTIGTYLAGAGTAFGLLSPVLGWLGVAATGSDTSANALFGAVQVAAARHVGVSPFLFAAANSEAGALGKLISPQNL